MLVARLVLVLLALAVALPAAAQTKKARKLLTQLKTVDGPGSGLDADALQGRTLEQLGGDALAAAVAYLTGNDYGREATIQLGAGLCNCATVACDDGNDFRLNCSGGFLPLPGTQGSLTAVGISPGTFNECGTCGCNVSGTSATLAVGVVCIAVP